MAHPHGSLTALDGMLAGLARPDNDADLAVYESIIAALERERRRRVQDFATLLNIEMLALRFYEEPQLRRRAWMIRERFRLLSGEGVYQRYEASNPPDPVAASRQELLADLENLLDQMRATYVLSAAREKRVRWLKGVLAALTLVAVLGAGGAYLYEASREGGGSLVLLIAVFGMLGALMSIMRRLQSLISVGALTQDPVVALTGLSYGMVGVVVALLSGAVFALLLYAVMLSGLLGGGGGLLPEFVGPPGYAPNRITLSYVLFEVNPKTYPDFAKLIVWSFAAGFAERLVPDVLDRIARRTDDSPSGKNGA